MVGVVMMGGGMEVFELELGAGESGRRGRNSGGEVVGVVGRISRSGRRISSSREGRFFKRGLPNPNIRQGSMQK